MVRFILPVTTTRISPMCVLRHQSVCTHAVSEMSEEKVTGPDEGSEKCRPALVVDLAVSDEEEEQTSDVEASDYDADSGEDDTEEEPANSGMPMIRMSPYHSAAANPHPFPGTYVIRPTNPKLPETVSVLTTKEGCRVYIVGTAHFSENSQEDVAVTINATMPDTVVVELCSSRINILRLDEETLLEEAKNINFEKIQQAIKQSGVLQGILHLLFLTMSAHITKQLGMAPGGEFRTALKEASKINGCRVRLGDRPIQVTLRRALGALSLYQKARLAWYMITSKEPISKEEVEKCKQKDLLEEMLKEMTGEFPALSQVFVRERDLFLAEFLRNTATMLPNPAAPNGIMPSVTVAVVGMGHVQGIKDHWEQDIDIAQLMTIPVPTLTQRLLKLGIRASFVALLSWGGYKLYTKMLT